MQIVKLQRDTVIINYGLGVEHAKCKNKSCVSFIIAVYTNDHLFQAGIVHIANTSPTRMCRLSNFGQDLHKKILATFLDIL